MISSNVNPSAGAVRQRPSGKWMATITVGSGRGAKKMTKILPTKKAALAWISEKKSSGVPHGEAAAMTVAQAFDNYLECKVLARNTVETFQCARARAVAHGIGATKLAALKPSQLDSFTAWMVRQGIAPSTVNLYATKLAAVLRFAAADGAMTFVPKATKVRVTTVKKTAIAPADVKALYEASSEDFAPIILLGAYTGMRASEAAAITVADIDFAASTITVSKAINDDGAFVVTKTPRSMRTIPVPLDVIAQLGAACKGKLPSAPVATNRDGGILTTRTFAPTFAAVADAAGIDITFHSLRKFFATTLLSSGVNPVAVAKYLGDTVEIMLKTYALEQSTDADEARAAIATAFQAAVSA
jgi:integrase